MPSDDRALREIDMESEHALLLEEAYRCGEHRLADGCLMPLLRTLDAIIHRERQAAERAGRVDAFREMDNFATSTGLVGVRPYLRERLDQLQSLTTPTAEQPERNNKENE